MIAYASRTGTRRNLAALRAAGWRLLLSPKGQISPLAEPWLYALDNGAWWSFQNKQPFDVPAFERAVDRFGFGADFIVVPDIVAGGQNSFDFSLTWVDRLHNIAPLLFAVQDGMTEDQVAPLLGPRMGIFVGGSTEFKLATMGGWARLARSRGAWCHVGRVNTARRIRLCAAADVDSFDGSSASKFAETLRPLDLARRQPDLQPLMASA